MQTTRSFIAIPLSREITKAAVRLIDRLKVSGDGIKWVPTDNLHLTLKFLGDIETNDIPKISDVVRGVLEEYEPFDLQFAGTGGLPTLEKTRVVYAGIDDVSGSLTQIVENLELDLAELGFKREPRDYVPHLTLGRTRGGSRKASGDVIARVEAASSVSLGTMPVDQVLIVGSFLDKQGPTYHVLDTIDL
ncbi:2',5' RNA ligase family [Rubripirellula tenax]|uniref:RNA 2',3'-cyclic phosphodiesterase n=1 Tax=Rubripirellula tenax TaxID=2528015 RepID=A0A5C6FFC9_9BACT|nr:RNA 2',3'-cyclic phosphodiesterase [Rubripirellula tenax]TWU58914.1 2',5' RNA ligase family [Rubripirellula tenax]